jgi:hypothetical protein
MKLGCAQRRSAWDMGNRKSLVDQADARLELLALRSSPQTVDGTPYGVFNRP